MSISRVQDYIIKSIPKIPKIPKIIFNLFIEHPSSVNMSYFQHFGRSISLGYRTGIATIVLVIHAIIPKFFQHTGSSIIKKLYKEEFENEKKGN